MTKRHIQELSKVWKCLLADTIHAFPELEAFLKRDLERFERCVEARGLPFLLVDLPAVGKHLDRCLANGEYNFEGLPATSRGHSKVKLPRFLGRIYLLIFDDTGRLKEEPDTEAIFFLRQLTLFAKKYTIPCPTRLVSAAVVEMADVDAKLPEPSRFWNDPDCDLNGDTYRGLVHSRYNQRDDNWDERQLFLANFDIVSKLLSSALGSYDPQQWRFKHGPGAVSEKTGKHDKYTWSAWSEVLERVFPIADCGYHSYSSWARRCCDVPTDNPSGASSRLIAVPKTYSGPRLIAAEPGSNMWCQQNLLSYMYGRSGRTWLRGYVSFGDQSINQQLARDASVTGETATIDLSMASDLVTPDLVGQLFRTRPELLAALRSTRTPLVSQHLTRRVKETIMLKKFSTMGNATTFPVESFVFLTIALASVFTDRRIKPTDENITAFYGKVSVFGDDIVIPKGSRETFVRALEMLHFKVNTGKSYWNGKFRESCGVDAYNGVNVTPVYYRQAYDGTARSLSSVLATRNRYYDRYLLNTASYLTSTLPRHLAKVAPTSGAVGITTRGSLDNDPSRIRYNKDLHRWEIRTIGLSSNTSKSKTDGDSALLQYFTERPSPYTAWESGYEQKPLVKRRKVWVGLHELGTQSSSCGATVLLLSNQ
jgi:hypothetical protein